MKFMILVKASKDSEAGVMPSEKLLTEMGQYNEELVKAGILLAGEGLAIDRATREWSIAQRERQLDSAEAAMGNMYGPNGAACKD